MAETAGRGLRVEITDLIAGYGAVEALHGVSLTVEPGQAIGIVGANGAGKSTLLRAISGLVPPRAGTISLAGQDSGRMAPHEIARLGVAHVPEGRQILQRMTVRENLMLGSADKAVRLQQMDRWLDTFPILRDKIELLGGQLSGGQQQMLAIARGLMSDPRLLLLDEPTLGLSPKLTDDLYYLLEKVRDESGATFVLVEQNIALAADLTTVSVVLQRGSIVSATPSKELMHDRKLLDAYLA